MDNGKNYYENSNSIVTMGVGDKALRLITKEIRDDITSNYPFTKIVGKPTMRDYLTLIDEASTVAVQQETGFDGTGNGEFGLLAIVLDSTQYEDETKETSWTYPADLNPPKQHPSIRPSSSATDKARWQQEQDELRENIPVLKGTEQGIVANIMAALEKQYFEDLKKPTVEYKGLKTRTLLDHLLKSYCSLTTKDKKAYKDGFFVIEWSHGGTTLKNFAKLLDKEQALLKRMKIKISDDEKRDHYALQVLDSGICEKSEIIEWEDKDDPSWDDTKKFFEKVLDDREKYAKSVRGGARHSGYESAHLARDRDEQDRADGEAIKTYTEGLAASNVAAEERAAAIASSQQEAINSFQQQQKAMVEIQMALQQKLSQREEQFAKLSEQLNQLQQAVKQPPPTNNGKENERPPPQNQQLNQLQQPPEKKAKPAWMERRDAKAKERYGNKNKKPEMLWCDKCARWGWHATDKHQDRPPKKSE